MQVACCDEEVLEVINKYFSLKNKYQTKLSKQKQKLISDTTLSKKERKQKYLKMPKLCVNCGKEGGTFFSESNRTYLAECRANPRCNLAIEVKMPEFKMRQEILKDYEVDNEDIKMNIISTRLLYIFGYMSESDAIGNFTALKDELNEIDDTINLLTGGILMIMNNPTKNLQIEENKVKLHNLITELKNLKKLYDEENASEILTEMVELQIKKIHPLVETIRLLKYGYNVVEYNENDNTYHLVQDVATPLDMELNFNGEKAVIVRNSEEEVPQEKTDEKVQKTVPVTKPVSIAKTAPAVVDIPPMPMPPFDTEKLAIAEKRAQMFKDAYDKGSVPYEQYRDLLSQSNKRTNN